MNPRLRPVAELKNSKESDVESSADPLIPDVEPNRTESRRASDPAPINPELELNIILSEDDAELKPSTYEFWLNIIIDVPDSSRRPVIRPEVKNSATSAELMRASPSAVTGPAENLILSAADTVPYPLMVGIPSNSKRSDVDREPDPTALPDSEKIRTPGADMIPAPTRVEDW